MASPFRASDWWGCHAQFTRSLADGGGDRLRVRFWRFDHGEGRKRHGRVRESMEGDRGGGNDWWPDMAAVSGAMQNAPDQHGGSALRVICSRACPGPCACPGHAVRLPVPVVAAALGSGFRAGAERRRVRGPAGWRIHDRIGGARPLPVRHGRVGQHAVARLPLPGDPLLWAYQAGRLHVRGRRASGWKSRGAKGASVPVSFGIRGAERKLAPSLSAKKSPVRGGLL